MKCRQMFFAFGVATATMANAATLYVNNGMSDYTGHNGATPETAYRRIQEAVSAASAGDTILVAPGVYGEDQGLGRDGGTDGSGHWWGSSRLCVTKSLHIKSTDGAEATHIVGAHDPSSASGLGYQAVRCMDVESSTAEVVVEGFTLRDGATRDAPENPAGRGGVLFCSTSGHNIIKDKTFLVDCVISNGTAASSALTWGGVLVRCRVQDNTFLRHVWNTSPDRYVSQGTAYVNTLFFRNQTVEKDTQAVVREGPIIFPGGERFVNCTFARNDATFYSFSTCSFYNTLVTGSPVPTNDGGKHANRVNDTTATRNLIAPALGDVRLRAGAAAATAGSAEFLADATIVAFPTTFTVDRFKDIYGADIPQSGTIAVGCAQTQVESIGGAVIAGDASTHFDERETIQYEASYAYPTDDLPSFRLRRELSGGAVVSRIRETLTQDGASAIVADVILPPDGAFGVTPPADADATLTVAFTTTDKVRYADPTVDESAEQDGTEEKPYRTLQQALESLDGAAGVVIANPGVYDSGEMTCSAFEVKARAVVPNGVILTARDGWTNTFIKGAACLAADQDSSTADSAYNALIAGMGKSAVRGVFMSGSAADAVVRGFTLTNCYVRGATDDGGMGHNSPDHHGAGVFGGRAVDCRFVDCHAFRGGGAAFSTLVNCLFERNVALYGGGATDNSTHYGCLSRENTAAPIWTTADGIFYWDGCENCTLLDARTGGPKSASATLRNTLVISKMGNGDIADDAIVSDLFRHCAFADDKDGAQSGRFKAFLEGGDGNVLAASAALAVDADGRPVVGSCAAVDAGDAALNSMFVGETDLLGGQRVYNGTMDIGALEGDWRPAFAKAIRRSRVTVSEATPAVTVNADGKAALTDGTRLAATVRGAAGQRCLLTVRVTGGGALTVTVDGKETVCTADAEIGLTLDGETSALAFSFAGAGEAVIEGLKSASGLSVIIQ